MRAKNSSTFKVQSSTLNFERGTLNGLRNPEKGTVLIVALLVVTFLSLLGTAFLILASTESRIAFNEKDFARALYVAETGIERARQDLKYDTAFDKLCGLFNRYFGSPMGPNTDTGSILGSAGAKYYDLGTALSACAQKIPAAGFIDVYTNSSPVSADTYSDGATYSVKLGNASGIEVTARSQGQIGTRAARTIEARFRVVNLSPWNNAAFAGAGASGASINGNVVIAGSVHILGTGIGATGPAAEFSGGGGIYNYYKDIDATAYTGKLPNVAPTTLYTEVRVKGGQLKMQSTSARVGEPDSVLTTYQDPVDGVYTNNGFGGTYGDTYVYSKNGKEAKYDVPSDVTVPFPCLSCTNPDTGQTYQQFLDSNSFTYPGNLVIDATTPGFSVGSGGNTLSWNNTTKTLTISGIIKVTGQIKLGGTTGTTRITTINYTGSGTLYSAYSNPGGNPSIEIHSNILPVGIFPTLDRIGFVAQDRIEIATGGGDSNLRLTGAFFGENKVVLQKQTQIAGSLVSNYFDMGNQVPALYQVPELGRNMPPGMPGSDLRIIFVKTLSWKELL